MIFKVGFGGTYSPGAGVVEVEEEDEEEVEEEEEEEAVAAAEVMGCAEEGCSAIVSAAEGDIGESSTGAVRLVKDWVGADLEQAAEGWVELSEAEEQLVAPAEEALELSKEERRTVKKVRRKNTPQGNHAFFCFFIIYYKDIMRVLVFHTSFAKKLPLAGFYSQYIKSMLEELA